MADREIMFVRHGQCLPPPVPEPGGEEVVGNGQKRSRKRERSLSPKGVKQARLLRRRLGKPNFGLILVSPELRTRQTAAIVGGEGKDIPTTVVSELSKPGGPQGKILEAMLSRLKNDTLENYHAGGERDISCLNGFGRRAWSAIMEEIGNVHTNVLVVGLPVLLPEIAWHACQIQRKRPEGSEKLLSYKMGECGAIRLTLKDDTVVKVEIIC